MPRVMKCDHCGSLKESGMEIIEMDDHTFCNDECMMEHLLDEHELQVRELIFEHWAKRTEV